MVQENLSENPYNIRESYQITPTIKYREPLQHCIDKLIREPLQQYIGNSIREPLQHWVKKVFRDPLQHCV